jgi:carboxyl-terminal processing protease
MNVKRYFTILLVLFTTISASVIGYSQTNLYDRVSAKSCDLANVKINRDVAEFYIKLQNEAYYKPSINLCEIDKNLTVDEQISEIFKSTGDYFTSYTQEAQMPVFQTTSPNQSKLKIGIRLGEDEKGVMVEQVTLNSAGDTSGVKEGDYIIEYNNTSTSGKDLNEVTQILAQGNNTNMKVLRDGQEIDLRIDKKLPSPNPIQFKLIDGIIIIQLEQFSENIAFQIEEFINKNNSAKGIILDLRFNPGGLVSETKLIAEVIGKSNTLGYFKYANQEKEQFQINSRKIGSQPVKTLINKNSASASEMIAGYMKDGEKSDIYGTISFGKGSRHSTFESESGAKYQITDALFLTPTLNEVNDVGIVPTNPTDSNQALNQALKDFKVSNNE